jgi:hypothetical protein
VRLLNDLGREKKKRRIYRNLYKYNNLIEESQIKKPDLNQVYIRIVYKYLILQ